MTSRDPSREGAVWGMGGGRGTKKRARTEHVEEDDAFLIGTVTARKCLKDASRGFEC